MSSVNFESSSHGKGQLNFHLEWCPKYRYNMLRQTRFKDLLAQVLLGEAEQFKVKVIELGIQNDHVHMVVGLRPTHAISKVFEHLKTKSAAQRSLNTNQNFDYAIPKVTFGRLENFTEA